MTVNVLKLYLYDSGQTYYSFKNGEIVVLIPEKRRIYSLGSVGTRIWELADGTHTVEEIINVLHKEFKVSKEKLVRDVLSFIKKLSKKRLLGLSTKKTYNKDVILTDIRRNVDGE